MRKSLLGERVTVTDREFVTLIGELMTFIDRFDLAAALVDEHRRVAGDKCACCKTSKYAQAPWPCVSYTAAAQVLEQRSLVSMAG